MNCKKSGERQQSQVKQSEIQKLIFENPRFVLRVNKFIKIPRIGIMKLTEINFSKKS